MEIRFSKSFCAGMDYEPVSPDDRRYYAIKTAAMQNGAVWLTTKVRGPFVRFTLPAEPEWVHDRVIRALLTLDPDATVRTARAVYEGLEDFEKQRGK